MNIAVTAKCIETVWDVIEERYISTSFGDASANIADTIVAAQKAINEKPSTTVMQQAIDQATELITGNLGGYVVLHDSNGDGKPDEILIMDDPDIAQAVKVWRWNQAGLGYSSTGYAGPYGLAMTANGEIVADFITTGTLNADLIKAGVIEDAAGNSTIDMSNGAAVMKDFKAKNSFQFLDENGAEKGYFSYTPADGTNLILKNQSGDLMIWLLSDSLGGSVYVYNAATKKTAVEATVDGNNAGIVYVNNSSGTDKIDLLGYNGHIWCTTVHQGSSRKIKKNIIPIEDAAKILELQAVSFDYIEEEMGTDCRGFIAEDVAEVLPNLVIPEEGKKPAGLDYITMIPYLQAVIKEQEKRITELEKKLNEITGG